MTLNIFNPKFCLSNHLSTSWSQGIAGSEGDKIPLEVAQGIPRLKFSLGQDSKNDWFCGAVALNSSWDSVDLTEYNFLNFSFYADDNICCRIGFKDDGDNDSLELDLHREAECTEGQECLLSLALHSFNDDGFNPKKGRLLKIIGYNNASFYISEVALSSEAVV